MQQVKYNAYILFLGTSNAQTISESDVIQQNTPFRLQILHFISNTVAQYCQNLEANQKVCVVRIVCE